jgi:hypothetical protein
MLPGSREQTSEDFPHIWSKAISMTAFSYLDGWLLSSAICLPFLIGLAVIHGVPMVRVYNGNVRERLDEARGLGIGPRFKLYLLLAFGYASMAAFALSCVALLFTAVHSVVNFLMRVNGIGIEQTISLELRESTLPLRISSVTLLGAIMFAAYRIEGLRRKARAATEREPSPQETIDGITREADREETFFASDNRLRAQLASLPHAEPTAGVFVNHMLHLGFISLAVLFCWVFLGLYTRSAMLAGLSWLTLFSAHDAGLVFGYYYLLKGRLLGWHWLRRLALYLSALLLIVVMTVEKLEPTFSATALAVVAFLAALTFAAMLFMGGKQTAS